MEANKELTFLGWIKMVKDLKAGWYGLIIIILTISCTAYGAYIGVDLFPEGRYPRLVLAIPGLTIGALAFFALCATSWAVFGKSIRHGKRTQKPIAKLFILLLFGFAILLLGCRIFYTLITRDSDSDWITELVIGLVCSLIGGYVCYAAFKMAAENVEIVEGK